MSEDVVGEPTDGAERSLLVAVARRFYLEDRSKVEIANELGLSRFKVARLLELARERNIVTIQLHDGGSEIPELSAKLATALGLQRAVVVESHGSPDAVRRQIGIAAAEYLQQSLRDGDSLGISWGRTINAMTEALTALPRVSVTQLTGTVGSDLSQSPVEMVRKVARSSGGSAHAVFTPMVVADARTAQSLRNQPDVAEVLGRFQHLNTAVLALGSWAPPESQLRASLTTKERTNLEKQGVVAEVGATLINTEGEQVGEDFSARCIAITTEQLRRVGRVILVAGGAHKAKAALAVAKTGFVAEMITDRALAETLLEGPSS
jgi:DNA-binding transcriptional regulator LsrR (DeoR family)